MAKSIHPGMVYQLKITLRDIKPPIWRRVLVPDCTLGELHVVIQRSMGWEDSHLHAFEVGRTMYSSPLAELDDTEDENRTSLSTLAAAGVKKFRYQYDFGDSWDHEVLIEKTVPAEADGVYPRCTTGKRACPPEDCGGAWGYGELLEVLADPEHPEHAERAEWMGGTDFDPDAFDLEAINRRLAGGQRRGRR